jgi:CheY-like chemotaxis protein
MRRPDTILIVDDDGNTRETIRRLLEMEGYEVASACDGREALELLASGLRPCMIVMDLSMPLMNAVDFRQRQLSDPDIAGIPVIAYSGVPDVRGRAHECRAADHLGNPSEFEHVLSIIRRHCNH